MKKYTRHICLQYYNRCTVQIPGFGDNQNQPRNSGANFRPLSDRQQILNSPGEKCRPKQKSVLNGRQQILFLILSF